MTGAGVAREIRPQRAADRAPGRRVAAEVTRVKRVHWSYVGLLRGGAAGPHRPRRRCSFMPTSAMAGRCGLKRVLRHELLPPPAPDPALLRSSGAQNRPRARGEASINHRRRQHQIGRHSTATSLTEAVAHLRQHGTMVFAPAAILAQIAVPSAPVSRLDGDSRIRMKHGAGP